MFKPNKLIRTLRSIFICRVPSGQVLKHWGCHLRCLRTKELQSISAQLSVFGRLTQNWMLFIQVGNWSSTVPINRSLQQSTVSQHWVARLDKILFNSYWGSNINH